MEGLVKLVGENIKELRIHKGLTREEFAEKCDIEVSYLARIERGEKNITIQTIEKIATALKESPSKIFQFEHIQIDKKYFIKEDLLKIVHEKLSTRSEEEIKMTINIIDEIFKVIN